MPRALAVTWDAVSGDLTRGAKRATLLRFDGVLGLSLAYGSRPRKLRQPRPSRWPRRAWQPVKHATGPRPTACARS